MRTLAFALGISAIAFPAHADIIHVDADAPGANDGSSWVDAYTDLQDALAAATDGDEIWVAAGVYAPTGGTDPAATFMLVDGTQLYGGFAGNESLRSERDWHTNETVLSGDLGQPPGSGAISENIVSAIEVDETTRFDGFTVRDGERGLFVEGGAPRIANALITGNGGYLGSYGSGAGALIRGESQASFYMVQFVSNVTIEYGAGVRVESWSSNVSFEHVLFENNQNNGLSGGGMNGPGTFLHVEFRGNRCSDSGGGLNGGGVLQSVLFIDNSAGQRGAGMRGDGTFTDVHFKGNNCPLLGGGLSGGGELNRVLFVGNAAGFGGGLYDADGGSTIVNSSFEGNVGFTGTEILIGPAPPLWGSSQELPEPLQLINVTIASYATDANGSATSKRTPVQGFRAPIRVVNSIVWSPDDSLGVLPPVAIYDGLPEFAHSIVQHSGGSGAGWDPESGTDLGGNLDDDPMFVDQLNADYRLAPGSPAIDAGDNTAVPAGISEDLDGNPRFMNLAVDMGAYEASGPLSIGEDLPPRPDARRYLRVSPTPFNATTTVYFGLERASQVTITIYDLAGRKVKTLRSGYMQPGDHDVRWHGRDDGGRLVASGVYVCRMQGDGFVETQRLVLVK